MKKLITLLLVLTGAVCTASATDYSVGSDQSGWSLNGTMTDNGDGTYSYILNLPKDYDNLLFTIFEGTTFNWDNAYRPKNAGNNWGIDGNNTPTMEKGANNYVLTYPVSSTIARALQIDFTPSTGACTVTRLIAVASGYNGWSTETHYLSETSRNSNIYTGIAPLEVSSANYDDGYQFVGINGKDLKYYAYKKEGDNEWIDTNQGNASVTADGYYNLTVNFSDYKWVAPTLVNVPATISDAGYATFSSIYPLDFTGITTVKAYRAESAATGKVNMTQVTGKVPAQTGLFLAGATTEIPTTICTTSIGDNLLKPTTGGDIYNAEKTQYVFAKQGEDYGFYKVGDSLSPDAGKAYLETTSEVSGARLVLAFDEDITAVEGVKAVSALENVYYNLAGQRVAQPAKGLYIVNGKKVIMK